MRPRGFYAEPWVWQLPRDYLERLADGESVVVGSKVLRVCGGCQSVIQTNKWLFGDVHICNLES
jgi:hypothetical protein